MRRPAGDRRAASPRRRGGNRRTFVVNPPFSDLRRAKPLILFKLTGKEIPHSSPVALSSIGRGAPSGGGGGGHDAIAAAGPPAGLDPPVMAGWSGNLFLAGGGAGWPGRASRTTAAN